MNIFRPLPQLVLFAALSAPFAAHADPRYSITVVGAAGSTATDVNNKGQVAGWFAASVSAEHAFLYSAGSITDLGTFGGANSHANALNDYGQVVGYADTGSGTTRAFLYSSGTMANLGTLGGNSAANGINNAGAVVGVAGDSSGQNQGFLYAGGALQNLAAFAPAGAVGAAYDINEAGQIVGEYTHGPITFPDWPSAAFTLSGGVFTYMGDIDQAFDSVALSVNDHGQSVGHAHAHVQNFIPFIYSAADGLHQLGAPSEFDTRAFDINNLGLSVGLRYLTDESHAMLYDGTWLDLNALIDPAGGWTLTQANGINDSDQIAATGCRGGSCYALRLDPIAPVPEPAVAGMLLAGLGLVGWRGRRRAALTVRSA
ncbi:MAG: hypothetical protein JWQ01_2027 [Massilia sp.]|nr:hypothetical protein [Massilia sp.]